jgi:hypothetical protein
MPSDADHLLKRLYDRFNARDTQAQIILRHSVRSPMARIVE